MIQWLSPLGRAQLPMCSSESTGPGPWFSTTTTNSNNNVGFNMFSAMCQTLFSEGYSISSLAWLPNNVEWLPIATQMKARFLLASEASVIHVCTITLSRGEDQGPINTQPGCWETTGLTDLRPR